MSFAYEPCNLQPFYPHIFASRHCCCYWWWFFIILDYSHVICKQILLLFSRCHVWLFATYGLQHTSLPYPLLSPRVCPNSSSFSLWCYLAISSSVAPFFCLQSCPASGLFQWISSLHQMAEVLEVHLQHQLFQSISRLTSFGIDWLDLFIVPFIMCFIVLLTDWLLVWWWTAMVRDHVQCSGENSKGALSYYSVLYFHFCFRY